MTKIFYGHLVADQSTPLGNIKVYENARFRWLSFDDSFIQTVIEKNNPSKPILSYLSALCCTLNKQSQRVFIAGAGGGAVLHYLNSLNPNRLITAIDICPSTIKIAQKFFSPPIQIHPGDAFKFIKPSDKYDHFLIDLFSKDKLPQGLTEANYYLQCRESVETGISINLLTPCSEQLAQIVKIIRDVFQNRTLSLAIPGRNNLVVHAFKRKDYLNYITSMAQLGLIQRPYWHNTYGMVSQCLYP